MAWARKTAGLYGQGERTTIFCSNNVAGCVCESDGKKDSIVVLYCNRKGTADVGHQTSARLPTGSSVYVNAGNKKTVKIYKGGKKKKKKSVHALHRGWVTDIGGKLG